MTYRIEISPTAMTDIEGIFLWMKGYSVDQAHRWVRGCYEIMLTLEKFPNRCPVAVESQYMDLPVRQLLYKKQYDSHKGVRCRMWIIITTDLPANLKEEIWNHQISAGK